jgi:hypothetical protein
LIVAVLALPAFLEILRLWLKPGTLVSATAAIRIAEAAAPAAKKRSAK